jgi:hypothetical protein
VNQHIINLKAHHVDTSTNKLYNNPHETSRAAAATVLHYQGNNKGPSLTFDNGKENHDVSPSQEQDFLEADKQICPAKKMMHLVYHKLKLKVSICILKSIT